MIKCSEECIPCCDYCFHYDFNGDDEGRYTGDGWCRLRELNITPHDACIKFICWKAITGVTEDERTKEPPK